MTVGHYIVYSAIPLVVYIGGTEWSIRAFILSFSVPEVLFTRWYKNHWTLKCLLSSLYNLESVSG